MWLGSVCYLPTYVEQETERVGEVLKKLCGKIITNIKCELHFMLEQRKYLFWDFRFDANVMYPSLRNKY